MRRLVEMAQDASGVEGRLAELVRGSQPFRPNPFTKRMVLQRVTRSALKQAWVVAHPVAAAAALGSAGVVAATAGWFVTRPAPELAQPALVVSAIARTAPLALPAPTALPEPQPAALAVPEQPRRPAVHTPAAPRDTKARVANEGEDPTQVLEAIRALRKKGDAARAQVLLDHYLTTHPGGALTEDALALAIEAASARHDPRAADYARRYLARFPNGRFRAVALRAAGRD